MSMGHPLSVVLGDIDNFKIINDSFGHPAGDEILREFARQMKLHVRDSDLCYRYGGEEFLMVLHDMTEEIACERADNLRVDFASIPFFFGTSIIHVTVFFGIATFPKYCMTGHELIAAADKALYFAKRSGRNLIKRWDEAISTKDPIPASG